MQVEQAFTTKLSATPPETSKHLMCVRDAKLIEKDCEGFFGLTAFGKIIVNLLPSIKSLFLKTKNTSYHMIYILSSPSTLEKIDSLPSKSPCRLGCSFVECFLWLLSSIVNLLYSLVYVFCYLWIFS
jgi:hypothetical protein